MSYRHGFTTLSKYLDRHQQVGWLLLLAWMCVVGGIIFFWNLGSFGLVDETEPLFAEAARQMLVRQDWVTPYFNEVTRFDKPPLIYWLMAIAYQVVGVNAWGARLPSALAALTLMGMLLYVLYHYGVKPHHPWLAGWLAALGVGIYATHPLTIIWGRTGVSDMLLTGCIGMALLCFFCGYASAPVGVSQKQAQGDDRLKKRAFLSFSNIVPNRSTGFYGLFYLFVGLAVLTKGPVGIVLPGLIVGTFLIYTGQFWPVWREMHLWLGLGLVVVLTLPWYVLVTLANGSAFIDAFFGYHNVERFTRVVNNHAAPWYFYFLILAGGFAPWSVFLPNAIAHTRFWQRSYWVRQPRAQHLGLFALCWLVSVFVFFTIAVTKLPSYLVPLMPAATLLVALQWGAWFEQASASWGLRLSGLVNSLFFMGLAIVVGLVPGWLADDPLLPDLASSLQNSGVIHRASAIAALAAVSCIGLVLLRRPSWLWVPNLVSFIALFALVLMPALTIVDAQRQLPLRQLAQAAAQLQHPAEPLVMVGTPKPSVVFYSRQPVTFLETIEQLPSYVAQQAKPLPSVLVLGSQKALSPQRLPQNDLAAVGRYRLLRLNPQTLQPS